MATLTHRTRPATAAASATFDNILKRVYDDGVFEQYATFVPFLEWLTKNGNVEKKKPSGEKHYFYIETRRSANVGIRGESAPLPTAAAPVAVQGNVDYNRGLRGQIEYTFEALNFAKGSKGAFADLVERNTRATMSNIKCLANSMVWGAGDGVFAKHARKAASAAVATLNFNVTVSETRTAMFPGTRWLYEGMHFQCIMASGNRGVGKSSGGNATACISAILSDSSFSSSATVALAAASVASAASWRIVPFRCYGAASGTFNRFTQYEGPNGISGIVDDATRTPTTYLGIATNTYPSWKSVIGHNSGTARALTLRLLYNLYVKMGRKEGLLNPKRTVWCNPDMFLTLVDLLDPHVQIMASDVREGEGLGFDKDMPLVIQGQPIKFRQDYSCPTGFWFLDPQYLNYLEGCPLKVIDEDGNSSRMVAGYDKFTMGWRWLFQLYTKKRNAHGALLDLSNTIVSV